MFLRTLIHLLLTGTPRVRRPASPVARVAGALQRPLAPDRLRPFRGPVWIADSPLIPGPRPHE